MERGGGETEEVEGKKVVWDGDGDGDEEVVVVVLVVMW